MGSRRRRTFRAAAVGLQVPALESRMLLSGVTAAIQIDQQAPEVLVDTEAFQLLSLTVDNSTRIFQSDGTQAGTIQLADIPGTVLTTDIYGEVNGRLIFRASTAGQLWSTDGTPGGTQSIANLTFDETSAESGLFQDRLYFGADGGNGVELWSTDGTTAGTGEFADINSGETAPQGVSFSFDSIANAVSYDVRLFASTFDAEGQPIPSNQLLGSANDVAGTTVTLLLSESQPSISHLVVTPNFSGGSQGAAVTKVVRAADPVDTVSSHPSQFVVFNDELWFAAETQVFGREWWKTDGTAAETQLAADVIVGPDGSTPIKPLVFDQQLFFGAYRNGDLYRTDGTLVVRVAQGTHGGGFPIAILNNRLIAQQGGGGGDDGTLQRLVSLDSSSAALHDIGAELPPSFFGSESSRSHFFQGFTEVNGQLVFRRTTHRLGRAPFPPESDVLMTDGLTTSVLDVTIGASTENSNNDPIRVGNLGPVSGNVLRISTFLGSGPGYHSRPGAILTDGTVEGTQVLSAANEVSETGAFGFLGERTFELRGRLDDQNQTHVDLYQIDPDGTSLLLELDSPIGEFVNFGGQLFIGRNVDGGSELAVIDPLIFDKPLTITDGVGQTQDPTPTLQWESRGSHVARYDLYINSASDRSRSVYRRSTLAQAEHTVEESLAEGSYEVWVRAIYHDGQSSRWGTPELLTIGDTTVDDTPISVNGGIGQQTTATPTLTWSDPGVDVDRYDVYINPLGDRSTASYRESNVTSASHTVQAVLQNGEYEVWLRVYYSNGTVSRWGSNPARLTVNAGPSSSGPPQILTPAATSTEVRPEFTWTATTGAQSYDIWISLTNPQSVINTKNIVGNTFTPNRNLPIGNHTVWVRANLLTGQTDWSEPAGFSIILGPPVLDVSNGVAAWPAVAGANRYEIWVDEVDEQGQQTQQKIYHNTQLTSLQLDLKSVLAAGRYTAWLRAIHDDGTIFTQSSWSVKNAFTLS